MVSTFDMIPNNNVICRKIGTSPYYTPPFPVMPQMPQPLQQSPHARIHNCIMSDFGKFWDPAVLTSRGGMLGGGIPGQLGRLGSPPPPDPTCGVYIQQIEELKNQCRTVIEQLQSGRKSKKESRKVSNAWLDAVIIIFLLPNLKENFLSGLAAWPAVN